MSFPSKQWYEIFIKDIQIMISTLSTSMDWCEDRRAAMQCDVIQCNAKYYNVIQQLHGHFEDLLLLYQCLFICRCISTCKAWVRLPARLGWRSTVGRELSNWEWRSFYEEDEFDGSGLDDDDKDSLWVMTFSKSNASVLLCRMEEWLEWCWTQETRFPLMQPYLVICQNCNVIAFDENTSATWFRSSGITMSRFIYHTDFQLEAKS